jgi:hypothetical protein
VALETGTYEMDVAPNCAICNAPAYPECPCEAERLQMAVKQAEQRAMDERMVVIRYNTRLLFQEIRLISV